MKSKFEELGMILYEYYEKINNQLAEQLKKQNSKEFKTIRGTYEIIKIEKIRLDELNIENEKIHLLFTKDGCNITGKLLVKAQAYPPDSDKNGFKSHYFDIMFDKTTIKFNFEEERFYLERDLNISYIIENDDLRTRLI